MWKREVDWEKSGNWFASAGFTVTMSGTISLNGCEGQTGEKSLQYSHGFRTLKTAVSFLW